MLTAFLLREVEAAIRLRTKAQPKAALLLKSVSLRLRTALRATAASLVVDATLQLLTGHRRQRAVLNAQAGDIRGIPTVVDWWRRVSRFASPSLEVAAAPVLLAPSEDTGGYLGEVSVAGTDVSRSGSAETVFRFVAWAADAVGTVIAADGGVVWNHNLGDADHQTFVLGDGSGYLGEVWVSRGINQDTIFRTGSYAGNLSVAAVLSGNPKVVSQASALVDAAGVFVAGADDSLALAVAEADTGGYQGELYADPEAGGWRVKRTGSGDVSCRISALTLI